MIVLLEAPQNPVDCCGIIADVGLSSCTVLAVLAIRLVWLQSLKRQLENVGLALCVHRTNFKVQTKPSTAKHSLIDHVDSVCGADEEKVLT